jgi:hypothetical protein
MAPTVYVSDMASNPSRSHQYQDTLDDVLGESLQATFITLTLPLEFFELDHQLGEFIRSPQEIL